VRSSPASDNPLGALTPGVDFFLFFFEGRSRARPQLTPKPKMLILGFPSNPTPPNCVDLDFLYQDNFTGATARHPVVHDLASPTSAFRRLPRRPSILQLPARANNQRSEFFTMSKSYNMAGWRIGFHGRQQDLVQCAWRASMSYPRLRQLHALHGGLDRGAGRPA